MRSIDQLQDQVASRLSSLPDGRDLDIAIVSHVIARIARRHPATPLSKTAREMVFENFEGCTDVLIAERATDFVGQEYLITLGTLLIDIAVDYTPEGHVKTDVDSDDKHPELVKSAATSTAKLANGLIDDGLSPYGALASIAISACHIALSRGLRFRQAQKMFADGISIAATLSADHAQQSNIHALKDEEQLGDDLAKLLGVSLETARKRFDGTIDAVKKRGRLDP